MKNKGICLLSFDDCYLREWAEWIPFMRDNGIRATFYISNFMALLASEGRGPGPEALRAITESGHTIGCHGANHSRAAKMTRETGYGSYYHSEIVPFFVLAEEYKVRRPWHYAYPYGNGDATTDRFILREFATVRYGGREVMKRGDLGKIRVIHAANFGKNSAGDCGHEPAVKYARDRDLAIAVHMHRPIEKRMIYLADMSASGMEFLGMGDAWSE